MSTTATAGLLTFSEAAMLNAALDVLHAVDDRLGKAVYATEDPREAAAAGRVAAIADVAGDAVFAILSHASAYGQCRNADATIRRRHGKPAADDEADE